MIETQRCQGAVIERERIRIMYKEIEYGVVQPPKADCSEIPVGLSEETISERKRKVLRLMKHRAMDVLVVYADLEHGSNFEYLTGYLPRFEEALLVLHDDGKAYLVHGNENLGMATHSRIPAEIVHAPIFSLPNQPMEGERKIEEILRECGIRPGMQAGIVGWKMFTGKALCNQQTYEIPHYLVEALRQIPDRMENAGDLFIHSGYGARATNNANEIAFYEFSAALASDCVLRAMDRVKPGVTEMELGACLNAMGQRNSVVTIAATGERFYKANLYPTDKKVKTGDRISLTTGYRGGLSSRCGYAVSCAGELPPGERDYMEQLVKPYYRALAAWLEKIRCGVTGQEMYDLVEEIMPKEKYHWSLCPGHLTAYEEWLSSPIYDGSDIEIKSGMLFQTDMIPTLPGYGKTGAESTIAIADAGLRAEIEKCYPDMWKRIEKRRDYLQNELHITLHEDVLPMTSTVGYLRPYLYDRQRAMKLADREEV